MEKEFDKNLFAEVYKENLLSKICAKKTLMEGNTFGDQLKFYEWVKNLPNKKIISIFIEQGEGVKDIRLLQGTWRRLGFNMKSMLVGSILGYFWRQYADPCYQKCKGDTTNKRECENKCAISAGNFVISQINAGKAKCAGDSKCIAKADKQLGKWQAKVANVTKVKLHT